MTITHCRLLLISWATLLGAGAAQPTLAVPATVRVWSPDGKPLKGAKVLLSRPHLWRAPARPNLKPTDAQGKVIFDLQPNAPRPNQFGSATVIAPDKSISVLFLRPGLNQVRLRKTVTARGQVVNDLGEPVAGARVSLRALAVSKALTATESQYVSIEPPAEGLYSTRSDAQGKWSIPGLPKDAEAFITLLDDRFANDQSVWRGADKRDLVLKARPGATIKGRVVDRQGKALPQIFVFAYSISGPGSASASGLTDSRGNFRLTGLPETDILMVNTSIPQGLELIQPAYVQTATKEGAVTKVPDIVLAPGIPFQGTLTDSTTGKGLPGAYVTAYSRKGNAPPSFFQTSSDDQGKYRVRVAPGDIIISVRLPGYRVQGKGDLRTPLTLKIEPGAQPNRDFKLIPIAPSHGVAVDIKGKPIPRALFRVGGEMVVTDKNGRWKAKSVESGNIRFQSSSEWVVVRYTERLTPPNQPIRVVLRRPTFTTVSGRVLSTDGQPLPKAKVTLVAYGSYGDSQPATLSGADGKYTFSKVPQNTRPYGVLAQLNGYLLVAGPGYNDFQRAGKNWISKDTLLAPIVSPVVGKVRMSDGTPAVGASVVANTGAAGVATAAQDGTFTLRNLVKGETKLTAFAGEEAATITVRIPSTSPPEIELKPLTKLASRDVQRAFDVLAKVADKPGFWARDAAARMLDGYDNALAAKLREIAGVKANTAPSQFTVLGLMMRGPENPTVLGTDDSTLIQGGPMKPLNAYRDAARGLSVWPKEKERAAQYLASAETTLRNMSAEERADAHGETILAMALTGALASQLNRPSALTWSQFVLTLLDRPIRESHTNSDEWKAQVLALAMRGGPSNYALYEGDVSTNARIQALSTTIVRIAATQTNDAIALLPKLEALYKSQLGRTTRNRVQRDPAIVGKAMLALIKPLGATQPQRAQDLAKRIPSKEQRIIGLALAAAGLSGEARESAYRQAFVAARESSFGQKAYVAALAHDVDPKLGQELIKAVLKEAEPRSRSGVAYTAVREVAFYLGRCDRAAARRLLEQSLANNKVRSRTGTYTDVESIALAMTSIDIDRAVELCDEIVDPHQACMVRIAIAKFALATESQRRELTFSTLQSYSWNL